MSTIEELLTTPQVDEEVWELDNRYEVNLAYSDDQGPVEVVGKNIGSVSNQISIQGESMSQYLEFMMPRYYDNIDLSDKTITIHYEMNGAGGEITPINMYRSQDKIKFGWTIPASATVNEGTLSIGIWARGYVGAEEYIWKSRITHYNIERGLVLGGGIPEPDENWYLEFVRQMDVKVSKASLYASRAKQSENVAVESKESAIASSQTASDSANTAIRKAAEASNSASVASAHSAAAKVSADNAKESETKAQGYAEEARNNAEGFEPISDMMTGESPTATNSTNAPLIYGKFKGYTEQDGEPTPDNPVEINGLAKDGAIEVKTCGKNLCDNNNFTITAGTGTAQSNYMHRKINIEGKLKAYKTYIMTADVKILAGSPTGISILFFDEGLINGTEVKTGAITNNHVEVSIKFGSNASKFYYLLIYAGVQGSTAGNSIEFSNVMLRESTTDATYEPYTETTATIPTDAPLYEGDYIEVYADGSGKLYKKFMNFNPTTIEAVAENVGAYIKLIKGYCKARSTALCNYLKLDATGQTTGFNFGGNAEGNFSHCFIKVLGLTTKEEYQSWLNERSDLEVIYELAEPTETPLTAEQVAQFKKLYTFEPITNVLCDGEVEMIYFKNNPNGRVAGMLQRQIDSITSTLSSTEEV